MRKRFVPALLLGYIAGLGVAVLQGNDNVGEAKDTADEENSIPELPDDTADEQILIP